MKRTRKRRGGGFFNTLRNFFRGRSKPRRIKKATKTTGDFTFAPKILKKDKATENSIEHAPKNKKLKLRGAILKAREKAAKAREKAAREGAIGERVDDALVARETAFARLQWGEEPETAMVGQSLIIKPGLRSSSPIFTPPPIGTGAAAQREDNFRKGRSSPIPPTEITWDAWKSTPPPPKRRQESGTKNLSEGVWQMESGGNRKTRRKRRKRTRRRNRRRRRRRRRRRKTRK